MFVGEWGIRPDSPGSADYVRFMHELMDEHFASATVWLWKEDSQGSWGFFDFDEVRGEWVERAETRRAHARVRAEAIAGEPIAMTYDAAARRFDMDRLFEQGYILDPRGKAKSVVLTEEGLARSREIFERLFAIGKEAGGN
jgi:hypothetical protein